MLFVAIALRYVKAMLYGFTALSSRLLGIIPNNSNSRVEDFHHRVAWRLAIHNVFIWYKLCI